MLRSRRMVRFGLVGALLIAAIAWLARPTPVEVDVVTVGRGPLRVTVDEEGRTRVRQRYVVSAPVSGTLQRVSWRPGDTIRQGEIAARLQPVGAAPLDPRTSAQLRARMEAARDDLARSRAAYAGIQGEMTLAQNDAKRAAALSLAGAISPADVEAAATRQRTAEEQLESAGAAVRVAEHALDEAQAALRLGGGAAGSRETVVVRAPVSARVLRVLEEHERVVAPGTPILELGDPGSLEVVVDVLSSDAVGIHPGARATFERWGGPVPLEGRVRLIEPSTFTKVSALGVEEQRVNVLVDFVDPAAAHGLGDGYAVDVAIVTDERADTLKVPTGALFRRAGDWAVFVVRDGRARIQPITIGLRAGFDAECLSGLTAGDTVIAYPGDRVSEGLRVTARGN